MPGSDTNKLLTVVIPAYNVAAYIAECIDSVLRQPSCKSILNIIIVVDGATDHTLTEVQQVAAGHEHHVQVVVQENAGLSAARNIGLGRVVTEYVTFLDGDDVWNPDYLAVLIPLLSTRAVDIVEYDAMLMDENSNPAGILKIASAATGETIPIGRDEFVSRFLCYTWARIYRTELVRRHPFPIGRRFEDVATTPWYYWYSQHQISIGRALVGYRQRPNSILKTPSPRDVEDLAKFTADAAAMYAETLSPYWQRVANRTFQQACRRITWQPLSTWLSSLRIARNAINGVPPLPGFSRWLQTNAILSYTALLYLKRLLFE